MRMRMQETARPANLKRGAGGIVDIEFIVQMLQLKHGRELPQIRVPGMADAINHLHEAGVLADADFEHLAAAYRTMRTIIGRLQLMNTTADHDLPTDPIELAKLARLLDYPDAASLVKKCETLRGDNRRYFDRFMSG